MPSAKTYTRSQYEKSFDLLMKYERIVVRRADQDTRAFDELKKHRDRYMFRRKGIEPQAEMSAAQFFL